MRTRQSSWALWTIATLSIVVFSHSSRGQSSHESGRTDPADGDVSASAVRVAEFPAAEGTEATPIDGVGVLAGGGTFSGVGADACFNVTAVPAAIGDPGSPLVTTIMGDNTSATGPDCAAVPFSNRPVWWEAFEITQPAAVRIDLCGTTPEQNPSYQFLLRSASCPLSGTACGPRLSPLQSGRGSPYCLSDNNAWWRYNSLAAGIYLIPIYSDEATLLNGRGPYEVHVTVEGFTGACCDLLAGTCADGVIGSACSGPNQAFNAGVSCCTSECLPPGQEFASKGVELLSRVSIAQFPGGSSDASDAWGYTSPSGREYALIGLHNATGIVEITDPFSPVIVATPSHTSSTWWDGKVYNGYLYTSNENGGGMQVINLTAIDSGFVTVGTPLTTSGLSTIHTTTVNTDSGYAYLNGTNLSPAGVHGDLVVVNLANPGSPVMVATGSAAQSYVHDSQVVTYHTGPYAGKEIAFCYCGQNGIRIVDVTNKANMVRLGSLVYDTLSYCHQGWLTDDRRYLFMDDELDEQSLGMTATTYVVNVEDLDNPFMAYSYTNDKCHIDHDLIVDGTLVYKASYERGLEVDDGMDPLAAHEVAFFDTHPEGNTASFNGVWGVYSGFASGVVLATDRSRGLFVLNYDCNRNRIDDTIDIANLTSADCNGNGFPDECELSGACAPAAPNVGNDTCVGGGNNGQPCAQHSGCPGGFCRLKNRYVTAGIPATAASHGIKVNLVSIDADSVATPGNYDGTDRWVGAPTLGISDGAGFPTFHAAPLQCSFLSTDWSAVGLLHMYGDVIVPGSTYDVSVCSAEAGPCSSVLRIGTAEFGDVITPVNTVNFSDAFSIVATLQGAPTRPQKTRSDLVAAVLNPSNANAVNFSDVGACVSALQLKKFREIVTVPPATCP